VTGSMSATLVIDLGSTSIKAALVDNSGAITALGERPAPSSDSPPGRHETDPLGFIRAVEELVHLALQTLPNLDAVAFSTQMHGVLLTDDENVPVSPFLSWQDERAGQATTPGTSVLEQAGKLLPPAVVRSIGVPLRVGLGALTLAAWLEEHPSPKRGRIHTLGSFVLSQVGGAYVTHLTNAAPLGLVRFETATWHPEVIAALGLSRFSLPLIVERFSPVGQIRVGAVEVDLLPDLGDHQASLLGSGLQPDDLAISLGTAGIAARIVPHSATAAPGVEMRPFPGGRALHVKSRLPGGRFAREFLLRSTGTTTVVDEARFWHDASDAARTGQENSARAFFSAYTDAYSNAIDQLFPGPDRPKRLLLNGGAAQHIPWFRDSFARDLGIDQVEVPDADLAIRGVAELIRVSEPHHRPRSQHVS
jgi:sugar (pentulose or hexulose) kinase